VLISVFLRENDTAAQPTHCILTSRRHIGLVTELLTCNNASTILG